MNHLNLKQKLTGNALADGNTRDFKVIVPLKYSSNFWKTLEVWLINCEINRTLTWSLTCVITNSTGARIFAITEAKRYVPVVTLSTQDNATLLR